MPDEPGVPPSASRSDTDRDNQVEIVQFLTRLGAAMSIAGASVTDTRLSLEDAAVAYNLQAQISVVPTLILIRLSGQDAVTIDVSTAMDRTMRLDQIAATFRLMQLARHARIDGAEGSRRLDAIYDSRSRFSDPLKLLGYMLMAVGVGLMLQPTVASLVGCLLLGLLVGELLLLAGSQRVLMTLMPVAAAMFVGLIVFSLVKAGVTSGPLLLLIPPLVRLLPGAMLTTGMIELTSGDIVSGASRFVAGAVQLLLLLFGLMAAAAIVGLPSAEAFAVNGSQAFVNWGPPAGVILYGAGVFLFLSAPVKSLPWLWLVLMIAWFGQLAGDQLLGGYLSGFVGAVVMTPVAYMIQRWQSAPPAMVTLGIQPWIGDVGSTVFALIAIALGFSIGELIRRPIVGWFNRGLDRVALRTRSGDGEGQTP